MALKTSGFTDGKSNKLGFGGQSKQLANAGVPGGVIGNLARKAGTAPGGPNFHGGKKKKAKTSPSGAGGGIAKTEGIALNAANAVLGGAGAAAKPAPPQKGKPKSQFHSKGARDRSDKESPAESKGENQKMDKGRY